MDHYIMDQTCDPKVWSFIGRFYNRAVMAYMYMYMSVHMTHKIESDFYIVHMIQISDRHYPHAVHVYTVLYVPCCLHNPSLPSSFH